MMVTNITKLYLRCVHVRDYLNFLCFLYVFFMDVFF